MIFGRLDNLKAEQEILPEAVREGLRFINDTDLANAPVGRVDIDGDRIFAMVQDYETKPLSENRPESHIRYLDIQYVVSGREVIGLAPLDGAGAPVTDLREERDLLFYDDVSGEMPLTMNAGSYAVFYPWDVHRPACRLNDQSESVRKVVVKIRL
ncbi:YhcH/YjgK/YiaL family protein [Martelella mediterranea]|uniref:YhcH/YjgK/YiaL family protein n=1 Tax=Martelella mediterranea TaxID=293089 RepID=A0A4R3NMJ0_9HYPH|nr:YhcH/YjgK/YiaL family protein [Martelella mediterranea]TCT32671.1 YhcH/YjgK/YiaL family protein [Martelella mediterranea]